MDAFAAFNLATGLVVILFLAIVILSRRARKHGGSYRTGVVGAMYEMHSRDKQKALDVIVEGRAAETRPEYPDGNLPELETPERGQAGEQEEDKDE